MNKSKFKKAKPLKITIAGQHVTAKGITLTAADKVFKSGTLGWTIQDNIELVIDGETVEAQVNLNITIAGTK